MHKSSINNGIFLGITSIICTYVIYWANPSMYFTAQPTLLFLIYVLIVSKSGSEAKRANGGFLTYGSAFKNMFVTGAIAVLLITIFDFFLYNYIGPELPAMKHELDIEAMENLIEMVGPEYESLFEEAMKKQEAADMTSLGFGLQNFIRRLFAPVAITAAFLALIMKKNPPSNRAGNNPEDQKKYVINK